MACAVRPLRLALCRAHCRAFSVSSACNRRNQLRPRLLNPPPDPLDITEDHGEFEKLFRNSHFAHLGVPRGQRVVARIIEIREDVRQLYVDFGCKVHAVVEMPKSSSRKMNKGDRVVIELHDTEITEKLQGTSSHFSILEGKARLVRSMREASQPRQQGNQFQQQQQQQQQQQHDHQVDHQERHQQQQQQQPVHWLQDNTQPEQQEQPLPWLQEDHNLQQQLQWLQDDPRMQPQQQQQQQMQWTPHDQQQQQQMQWTPHDQQQQMQWTPLNQQQEFQWTQNDSQKQPQGQWPNSFDPQS